MKTLFALFTLTASAFAQSSGVGSIWTTVTGTLQSGATANGNGTALAVGGLSSAILTVNCSVACSGGTTINFEGSQDTTNFVALNAVQLGSATIASTVVNQGTTITAWQIPIGGLQSIRARISAYSAGTITVTATATAAPYDPKTLNSNAFLGGTAADGNSGNKSAQTQRVVIATDQPALTNKLLVTPDSVALPANQSVNQAQVAGTTTSVNNGTVDNGTTRVTIASNSTGTVAATESGTWTVQPGNTANTTAWLVQSVPGTTGGLSTYVVEPGASDNHANIKNGAGTVYHVSCTNNSATINYLRLYNAASGFNGCNSATNLLWEVNIPASTSGAGFVQDIAQGLNFGTGISICITGSYGQTSTTNATASAIQCNVGYK